MKRSKMMMLTMVAIAVGSLVIAQESGVQKSLSSTMNVFVFPNEGQDSSQQSKDEAECYQWAVQNTGTDPFDLQKQAQQQQQQGDQAQQQAAQTGQGAGATGAVKGAAGGALIGAIAGDAGKGAAIGATAGLVGGRRQGRRAQQQAVSSADQQSTQAQAATAEQLTNFKKAFSVCLEAKDYMVKH